MANQAFMHEYMQGTKAIDDEDDVRARDHVQLNLEDQGKLVHIWSIVNLGTKGGGEASRALDWLCSMADRHHTTLQLYPEKISGKGKGSIPSQGLRKWYMSRGFTEDRYGYYQRQPSGKTEAGNRLATQVKIDHLLSNLSGLPDYTARLNPLSDGCEMIVELEGRLSPAAEKAIDNIAYSVAQRLGYRVKDLGVKTNKMGMVVLDYIMHDVE